ncbi:hypothetical protein [Spiroplasma endosymbiont of Asaphidion curtum]|uniref:hypothetical protein n=1 Tax=Spiroplasma endosymbiont of Asaphidion curtum TaxID=3066281 RepID=UPI003CC7A30B
MTKSAINLAHKLGITSPQVAMLSFSTANSVLVVIRLLKFKRQQRYYKKKI